ncbi:helix-turn-helix transcriptional regulator [Macrococcoides caseolyticum]|uniref:helix-turn-helix transcriptional regulator n=1 Tax=Macrococcoides caseolyticum TaxID=69966 RepID=UPI000C344138|nr:helix-turn-helix transcriptional regulator [Macrococcus caseolyticus]PKE16728.1 transcriptional regulator [Macrococcus caseolyticus]
MVVANKSEIKILLIRKGLTVTDLSKKIHSDLPYLSQVLNGKRNPSPKLAKRIADALDVEITDIFTIEINKEAN